MALLEREQRNDVEVPERPPMWARRDLKSRLFTYFRRALSLALVLIATCAGGYLVLVGYHAEPAS